MNYIIMPNEAIKCLNIMPKEIYIDCTFGLGGHTKEILKYLNLNGKIIIIDKEIDSFFLAKKIYKKNDKLHKFLVSFNKIDIILNKFKNKISGIIADLGLSIYQLESQTKGFGFKKNCVLDMRNEIIQKLRVIDWINIASTKEMENIFNVFFEKKNIKNIIKKIIQNRKKNLIKTNKELINIISPYLKKLKGKKNIYKFLLFVKIFINNDLNLLESFIKKCFDLLKKNGKLILISFNSIEDLVIKNILNKIKQKKKKYFIKPSTLDLNNNYSSRSAFMRIIKKI